MKKILFTLQFLFIFTFIFAQNKPQKNDFGIGIDYKIQKEVYVFPNYYPSIGYYDYRYDQVNLFPALKFDYYLKEDMTLNLFLRPIFLSKVDRIENVSPNKYFSDFKFSRFSIDLGLGFEKHFFKKMKIDPFVGVNMHYLFSGKELFKSNTKNYNYNTGLLEYDNSSNSKSAEVHGFYSTINFGMNYFIVQNFSLGINMDLGYRYSSQIGKNITKLDRAQYDSSGSIIRTDNSSSENEVKNISSGFIYSFSIKSAFYFPLKKKEK